MKKKPHSIETRMLRTLLKGDFFYTTKEDKLITSLAYINHRKVITDRCIVIQHTDKEPVATRMTKVTLVNDVFPDLYLVRYERRKKTFCVVIETQNVPVHLVADGTGSFSNGAWVFTYPTKEECVKKVEVIHGYIKNRK